jgi:capsid protein
VLLALRNNWFWKNPSLIIRRVKGWIDPVKETKASKIRLEIGLSTLEDECATQGLDWEEVLEQRAREQAKMRELGLNIIRHGVKSFGANVPTPCWVGTRTNRGAEGISRDSRTGSV